MTREEWAMELSVRTWFKNERYSVLISPEEVNELIALLKNVTSPLTAESGKGIRDESNT